MQWLNIVTKIYKNDNIWHHGVNDLNSLHEFGWCDKMHIIPPWLNEYTISLINIDVDYIDIRLHTGIRALQNKHRALIIGIDNRAIELSKNYNLPLVPESGVHKIQYYICRYDDFKFDVLHEQIHVWKGQFIGDSIDIITPLSFDLKPVNRVTKLPYDFAHIGWVA